MRIFVTGATGFIGAHFVEAALRAGHTVVGLYRSEHAKQRSLLEQLQVLGAHWVQGDVLETGSLQNAIAGADCVCHFAAAFREPGADEAYFERLNVTGTANVLDAAAQAGVKRFVHCSTAGIYGQRVRGVVDETAPVRPWNSYERSKVAAEREVRTRANAAGMEYVILRPTSVYGPRDERLRKLFSSVAKGRFPLFGRGEGRRHMVYVTDVAEAFLQACVVPQAANRELIIAGPEAVPLKELLQTLARAAHRRRFGPRLPLAPMTLFAGVVEDVCAILKIKPPLYRRRMDFYLNDAAFSSQLAQRVLGWRPKVHLPEGLAATLHSLAPSAVRRSEASGTAPALDAPAKPRAAGQSSSLAAIIAACALSAGWISIDT